jgi:BirA family transcriptional regulator, biotin operon repressor / biotin---[acetyl-CoA-carboxylase] ligase
MTHPVKIQNDARRYLGKSIYYFESIGSTNDELLSKIGSPYVSGDVLTASRQHSGKGRRDRKWLSPAGGLYFSILFEEIPTGSAFYQLVLLMSLSVLQTLESQSMKKDFYIKWPNDIYYQDRKIVGILTQSRSIGDQTDAVIGTGINLNAPFQNQDGLRNPAISLTEITKQSYLIPHILDEILNHFDQAYRQWVLGKFENYLPILNQKLYNRGLPQVREYNGKSQTIIPLEFTNQGYLRADVNGILQEIHIGELH